MQLFLFFSEAHFGTASVGIAAFFATLPLTSERENRTTVFSSAPTFFELRLKSGKFGLRYPNECLSVG